MEAHELLEILETLAPLSLAEEWDNVGLLVQPSRPRSIDRVLLCIDLTDAIIAEAAELGAQWICAYHPPIFGKLARIDPADRTGRLVLASIEHGIAVYSPHTALDATAGGVNDWLAEAFDPCTSTAIIAKEAPPTQHQVPPRAVGQGRRLVLPAPLSLDEAIHRVKQHLGLSYLRVADGGSGLVESIALCPGAGGSVVQRVRADLYLTGEMRHHDVLAAVHSGTSVVLTEHSNSERGYLTVLKARMVALTDRLQVFISQRDQDPLTVV